MASSHHSLQLPLFTALLVLLGTHLVTTYDTSILKRTYAATTATCYASIFSFGDSLADTGNILHYLGDDAGPLAHLPYGETYFHRATGRFSDGRLVIDFIAQALGLPLVPPYLAGTSAQDFRYGANFAVAGATALDNDFFRAKGLDVTWTEYSLVVQFNWFKQLLPSLCSTDSDSKGIVSNSLFLVGEIGWNDHSHSFEQGRTADEIRTFIPKIIEVISSVIDDLIKLGARTLVVPGIFPSGCVSTYLTMMKSENAEDYDPDTGCIKWVNEFSAYHNQLLQNELDRIRRLHPHVIIIYADYYEALMSIFRSPQKFGRHFFSSLPNLVLTVNQVVEILLKFLETRDWKSAFFQVIPPRKRGEAEAEEVIKDEKTIDAADIVRVEDEAEGEDVDDGDIRGWKKQRIGEAGTEGTEDENAEDSVRTIAASVDEVVDFEGRMQTKEATNGLRE